MTDTLATIIVVTHNSARWLPFLTAALARQNDRRWRLVVVDNASQSGERPTLAALPAGAVLIQNSDNIGFAAANNQAAQDADTPFLIFLNPDAFPKPDWFEHLIDAALRHPDAGAIGSTQVRAEAETTLDGAGDVLHASGLAYRSLFGKMHRALPPLGETFAACAAAMLVRKDAFDACGGFDANYFCFFEDIDLCFRMRLLGWRVLQSPDAVVAHVSGGASTATFANYHGARNRVWTFIKCMPPALFWPLLPVHLLANIAAVSAALFKGQGLAAVRGFAAGLGGWPKMWSERSRVQRGRVASTAQIARMLVWNPWCLVTRYPHVRPLPVAPLRDAQAHLPKKTEAALQKEAATGRPQRDHNQHAQSDRR